MKTRTFAVALLVLLASAAPRSFAANKDMVALQTMVQNLQTQLQQLQHLDITVLLHHVDAVMVFHKFMDIVVEGIGADAQIIRSHAKFLPQLVAALKQRPV